MTAHNSRSAMPRIQEQGAQQNVRGHGGRGTAHAKAVERAVAPVAIAVPIAVHRQAVAGSALLHPAAARGGGKLDARQPQQAPAAHLLGSGVVPS